MTALVTVRNDGPDDVELDVGKRTLLLRAGQQAQVATTRARLLALERDSSLLLVNPAERLRVGED